MLLFITNLLNNIILSLVPRVHNTLLADTHMKQILPEFCVLEHFVSCLHQPFNHNTPTHNQACCAIEVEA